MVKVLPNNLRYGLVSVSTISFDARRKIRRTLDNAPNIAPADSVANVIVVVTVEIMYR